MKRCLSTLMAMAAIAGMGATGASADTIFDVEHARAIARSGGPVSSQEAEFLNRWGALSGTPDWRGNTRETWEWYLDDTPRQRRQQRRIYRD